MEFLSRLPDSDSGLGWGLRSCILTSSTGDSDADDVDDFGRLSGLESIQELTEMCPSWAAVSKKVS